MPSEQPKIPNSSIPPFALRLQPELKAVLEERARENGRSLNAEITARLEKSIEGDDSLMKTMVEMAATITEYDETLGDHDKRIDRLESRMSDVLMMLGRDDGGRD